MFSVRFNFRCYHRPAIFLFFFHRSKGFSNRDCLYVKQEKQVYEKTSIIILLFKNKNERTYGTDLNRVARG